MGDLAPGGSSATGREPGASGPDGERAGPAVEVGHLEQQVAPGQVVARPHGQGAAEAVHRVERPGEHEPLGDRTARPGPVPQVGERAVRLPRDDPLHLGGADPLDVGQREPDAVTARVGHAGVEAQPGARQRLEAAAAGPVAVTGAGAAAGHLLDPVGGAGGVDVEAEHRDAERAGVVEDQPLGVHAGVVGEDAGEERRRVVRLEPGRLVGRYARTRRHGPCRSRTRRTTLAPPRSAGRRRAGSRAPRRAAAATARPRPGRPACPSGAGPRRPRRAGPRSTTWTILITCSWKTTTPWVSSSAGISVSCR